MREGKQTTRFPTPASFAQSFMGQSFMGRCA